jgi:DNA-binding CsgD family transcriptional regulator
MNETGKKGVSASVDGGTPSESEGLLASKRRRGFHRAAAGGSRKKPTIRRDVDLSKVVGVVARLPIGGDEALQRRRRLLAEMCKVLGAHLTGSTDVGVGMNLAPRLRQTLELLVAGDSERQVALKLKISQHTVHVYVKQLYKRFGVSSRGELLARFVRGVS